jgi:hypothetical protein
MQIGIKLQISWRHCIYLLRSKLSERQNQSLIRRIMPDLGRLIRRTLLASATGYAVNFRSEPGRPIACWPCAACQQAGSVVLTVNAQKDPGTEVAVTCTILPA